MNALMVAVFTVFSPFILGDIVYTPPIGEYIYMYWPAILLIIVIIITVILILKAGKKK